MSAGLAAFAGSGKKKKAGVPKKQGKKIKKGVNLAAQIGSIIADSQGAQLLGDKFAGVYSSDQRPALSKKKGRTQFSIQNQCRLMVSTGLLLLVCPRLAK